MKAYQGTQVNYMKSQAKIGDILARNRIYDKQFTHIGTEQKLILLFKKDVDWEGRKLPLGVKIEIDKVPSPITDKERKECDRKHRVLFHWIKSKFEAINEGLYEDVMNGFIKEFYPNLLMGSKTIIEHTLPQFERAFLEGKTDVSLRLEDKRGDKNV